MTAFITTEDEVKTMGSTLICPRCKNGNLHQTSCTTFWRESEDADSGKIVTTSHESIVENSHLMSGNPSNRRDGIVIRFDCEQCAAGPMLSIKQHKGTTYIGWDSMRVIL